MGKNNASRAINPQNGYGTVIRHQICSCKRPGYYSRQDAKLVCRQMRRRYNDQFSAYKCETTSDLWHVTNLKSQRT
jgi:hypothetical protein